MFHLYMHSFNGTLPLSDFSINKIIAATLGSWGIVGVDTFVLISAYFISGKEFRLIRIIRLWLCVSFYYFVIGIICSGFSLPLLLKSIFIPISNEYWFIQAFIMMLLFAPFFNKFIQTVSDKCLTALVCMLTVTISLYHTVYTSASIGKWAMFILLFFTASLLKRNPISIGFLKRRVVKCFIYSFSFIIIGGCYIVAVHNKLFPIYASLIGKYSFVMFLIAILVFNKAQKLNISSILLNNISGGVLGVYVISENHFLYNYIYNQWNPLSLKQEWYLFLFYFIVYSLMIFISASSVELLRGWIFSPIINCMADTNIVHKIDRFTNNI